jgi:hypothetical protein
VDKRIDVLVFATDSRVLIAKFADLLGVLIPLALGARKELGRKIMNNRYEKMRINISEKKGNKNETPAKKIINMSITIHASSQAHLRVKRCRLPQLHHFRLKTVVSLLPLKCKFFSSGFLIAKMLITLCQQAHLLL